MSKRINDGGPAFPSQALNGQGEPMQAPDFGMSLRDYFAAKASDDDIAEIIGEIREMDTPAITRTQARYIHADAMLAARQKNPATK